MAVTGAASLMKDAQDLAEQRPAPRRGDRHPRGARHPRRRVRRPGSRRPAARAQHLLHRRGPGDHGAHRPRASSSRSSRSTSSPPTGLAVGIDYSLFIVSRYREERHGGLDEMAAHRRRVGDRLQRRVLQRHDGRAGAGRHAHRAALDLRQPRRRRHERRVRRRGRRAHAAAGDPRAARRQDRRAARAVPGALRAPARRATAGGAGRRERIMRRPAVEPRARRRAAPASPPRRCSMRSGGFSAAPFPTVYTSKQGLDMLKRDFAAGHERADHRGGRRRPGRQRRCRTASSASSSAVDEDGRFTARPACDQRRRFAGRDPDDPGRRGDVRRGARPSSSPCATRSCRRHSPAPPPRSTWAADRDEHRLHRTSPTATCRSSSPPCSPLSFVLLLVAFRSVVVAVDGDRHEPAVGGRRLRRPDARLPEGLGAESAGPDPGVTAIESWVPLLMFCVLFGLSMDYQVFLLSRIRERWSETHDSRDAVVFGVQSTAGIITGAALIMVAVFLGMGSGRLDRAAGARPRARHGRAAGRLRGAGRSSRRR